VPAAIRGRSLLERHLQLLRGPVWKKLSWRLAFLTNRSRRSLTVCAGSLGRNSAEPRIF